jgi:hypothetical protein
VDELAASGDGGLSVYTHKDGLPPYLGVWTDPEHGNDWHLFSDYPADQHERFGWERVKTALALVVPPAGPICDARRSPGNYHLEGRCDYCDAITLSQATLGQVEDRYNEGRVWQYQFEAYRYVFALLSPSGALPYDRETPTDPPVREFARMLLRAKNFEVPETLAEPDGVTPIVPGHATELYAKQRAALAGAEG